ncbi:hypothetical protein REPUB_Repub08aG0195400 [Reevesia pubescens]
MASLSPPSNKPTSEQPGRIRVLKEGSHQPLKKDPVVYWMLRDQRLKDNWALIHAVDQANKANVPVAIAFNLFDQFLGAKARQLGFMLKGLPSITKKYSRYSSDSILLGEAEETIPKFLGECGASLLVTDFSPLRQIRKCKDEICKRVSDSVTIHEVDAHNIVPIWVTSDKLEYSARTIRGKINKLLPEYLIDFPMLQPPNKKWDAMNQLIDWDSMKGAEVPEIEWCEPGETAAMEVLDGFLTKRLKNYSTDRNIPLKPRGAWEWAHKTLEDHASDKQEHIYTMEQLEKAQTADSFWNASQMEMVHHGKMHGFMRQFIFYNFNVHNPLVEKLQNNVQYLLGLKRCIYLNDKYEIDGRDANGYVGCMWSICGVHDQECIIVEEMLTIFSVELNGRLDSRFPNSYSE